MDVERYFDGTIGSVNLQKSGDVEGTLDFAIFALYNDGISFDRLSGEQVRGENRAQLRRASSRSQ